MHHHVHRGIYGGSTRRGGGSAYMPYTEPAVDPRRLPQPPPPPGVELRPLSFDARSANELRPLYFADMIGQSRLRTLLPRIVATCKASGRPLQHTLLVGESGTGKTTVGQVLANELSARCFQIKAPVAHEVLAALQRTCKDGDVLIVDECHQIVVGDRRGVTQTADPEDWYHILEDRRLATPTGMMPFPAISVIACTTDSGLLPQAWLNRFPLHLKLDPYTDDDMAQLAAANAGQLHTPISPRAAAMLGRASGRNPRQCNSFVRNCLALGSHAITEDVAEEVIVDLNGYTLDGLSPDAQTILRFLYLNCRRVTRGEVRYQSSMNALATATGHSRDTKALQLFVEPKLLAAGLLTVEPQGRRLTERGIARAAELCQS